MNISSAKDRSSKNNDTPQLAVDDSVVPLATDKPGQTTPSQSEERVPRLPHERDESVDSQAVTGGELPSGEHIQQAFEDVERGLVNTDRGLEGNTLVKDALSSGEKKRDNPRI